MRAELERYADRPLKIGSFCAASKVTGIVSDTYGIAALLHEHGALSFWDFAACAPYGSIEMTAPAGGDPAAYKDGVFISPHKFIGGPGTPGVLAARRQLLTNRVPATPGGGTVINKPSAAVRQTLSDDGYTTELEQRPSLAFALIGLNEDEGLVGERVMKHASELVV